MAIGVIPGLLLGAGIGAGAGYLGGGKQGALRGAMIGGGIGAGVGGFSSLGGAGAAGGTLIPGTNAATLAAGTLPAAGAAGGTTLFNTMMLAGMGMSALQAFGGGGATGAAPQFAIPLSPEGKKLQKTLFEKTKEQYQTGLMPENLASIYIGKVKRQEAKEHKMARGFLTSMAGGVRTGTDVKALLTEGGRRMGGLTAPTQWRMGAKEEEFRNALAMLQNIRNIEKQTPLLRAQAQMYKTLTSQGQRAAQGQALGDIAQMAAMMKAFG